MMKDLPKDKAGVAADEPIPGARSFPTIAAMAAYQEERELAEALRVQAMSPQELALWLRDNWDPLQIQAASLFSYTRPSGEPRVRHFATLEAKNRYDEQREIEQAVKLAISRRRL